MSKELVPGENSTTSPGFASDQAMFTASCKAGDLFARHVLLPRLQDAVGHFANQNHPTGAFADQRRERVEGKALVLAAGDQNDRAVLG